MTGLGVDLNFGEPGGQNKVVSADGDLIIAYGRYDEPSAGPLVWDEVNVPVT